MNELNNVLYEATAAIAPSYFSLPVLGGDARFRERVYCYELYHQMRLRWPEGCQYLLNGEVDKRLHPYFEGRDPKTPDFLVHVPGSGDNHAIIEVKPFNSRREGFEKDVETLALFRREFGYQRAIHLVYGASVANTQAKVRGSGAKVEDLGMIEIWAHPHPGTPAGPG